jgi:hypothetical protein
LRYRLKWLQSQLTPTTEKAQKETVLEGLNLSGAWSCGRANNHDFNIDLQHADGKITGTITGTDGSGLTSSPTLESSYLRGALSGFWQDNSKQTEQLDLPVTPGATRMMFNAVADTDGKRFQFTYAPKHPRIALSLQDVICERGQRQAAAAPEFLEMKQLPVPADNSSDWKLDPGEGWVRAMISTSNGSQTPTEFVILKGRQRLRSSLGTHVRVAAGTYTMVIRLGGRQSRKEVTVAAGSLNELQVRAGVLKVNSVSGEGNRLETGFSVYDPSDKAHQGTLVEGWGDVPVNVTPGDYTVIVGDLTGFPLVMDVSLAPGQSLELDARWKQIRVPELNQVANAEFIILREELEGADTNDWRSVSAPLLKKTANGVLVFVPEGTYSAKILPDRILGDLKAE